MMQSLYQEAYLVGIFSFSYSRRFFLIFAVVVVAALTVRAFLVPAGFGELGHWRTAAPLEEAAREPTLQGKAVCGACHAKEFAAHEKDVHKPVQCENCHGAGQAHVDAREAKRPASEGVIFRELAQSDCLACHRRVQARSKLFPTIDVPSHFAKTGVSDLSTPCQSCHDPHEPMYLEHNAENARIHPLIHPCADCHTEVSVADKSLPEGHVVTFQCKDCHAALVADFETRPHKDIGCASCHPFHRSSEFSGQIYKNGSPRFCLMCHEKKSFKDGKQIPLLESFPAHLQSMGMPYSASARCVDCHGESKIHVMKGDVVTSTVDPGVMP